MQWGPAAYANQLVDAHREVETSAAVAIPRRMLCRPYTRPLAAWVAAKSITPVAAGCATTGDQLLSVIESQHHATLTAEHKAIQVSFN